jgi:hypothetical protein
MKISHSDNSTIYRTVETLLRMAGEREPETERTLYGMAKQAERKLVELRHAIAEIDARLKDAYDLGVPVSLRRIRRIREYIEKLQSPC